MSISKVPIKIRVQQMMKKKTFRSPAQIWGESDKDKSEKFGPRTGQCLSLLRIQQWFVSGKWMTNRCKRLQIKPRFLHVLEIFNLCPLDLFRRELQELQETSNFANFMSQQNHFCQQRTWKLQVISFNSAMGTWPNALTLFVEMVALHLQSRGLDFGGAQNGCFLH